MGLQQAEGWTRRRFRCVASILRATGHSRGPGARMPLTKRDSNCSSYPIDNNRENAYAGIDDAPRGDMARHGCTAVAALLARV